MSDNARGHGGVIRRYKDLALLLFEHRGLASQPDRSLTEALLRDVSDDAEPSAEAAKLADELEALGPTFVKLGQMLSGRPDLLPADYVRALSRLQDDVAPFDGDTAAAVFESELGVSPDNAFAEFDHQPMAAASLGQVHAATLRDGTKVVVKIQRPGIREQIIGDLDVFASAVDVLENHVEAARRYAIKDVLRESRRMLIRELDYRQEAVALTRLADMLTDHDDVILPAPIPDFCSGRVLTMTHIDGRKVTALPAVMQTEQDTARLADTLYRCYLDQVLVAGVFHADPHPGNVLVTPDAKIGLIDLGMTATLDPDLRESLLHLLLAMAEGQGRSAAEQLISLSDPMDEFDRERYLREASDLINRQALLPHPNVQEGRLVLELVKIGGQFGLRPPPELGILGKTLLHLDACARALSPQFNAQQVLRQYAEAIIQKRSLEQLSPAKMISAALEGQTFVQELPGRLNQVMDAAANNRLRLKVDAIDEAALMLNLQKIANRIAVGLVLAALIVGAALMLGVDSGPKLFGYPVLALGVFTGASVLGFAMVISAFRQDRD